MRTKNELYQEALRTVALRRQTARALAQDAQAQAEAAIDALPTRWNRTSPVQNVRIPAV